MELKKCDLSIASQYSPIEMENLRPNLISWNLKKVDPLQRYFYIYSWLSLSRIRLTRISGWVEFLSRTSLCINIYNLTPVELNSDESKFRLSRIKVLVPRCKKPYYLHSLSQIYLSKHVYYLGIKIDHRWNIRSLNLTFLP